MKTNIIECIHQEYQAQQETKIEQPLQINKVNGIWEIHKTQQEAKTEQANVNELVADLIAEIDDLGEEEANRVVQEASKVFSKTFPDLDKEIENTRKKDLEAYNKALSVIEGVANKTLHFTEIYNLAERGGLNFKSEQLLIKALYTIAKTVPTQFINIKKILPTHNKKAMMLLGQEALTNLTKTEAKDWDLQNSKKCFELLLKATKEHPHIVRMFIQNFSNLSENDRTTIALASYLRYPFDFGKDFENFQIKEDHNFLKIALAIAESTTISTPTILWRCLKTFKIESKSEKVRFHILLEIAKKNPELALRFLKEFAFTNADYWYRVASIIVQHDPELLFNEAEYFSSEHKAMRNLLMLVAALSQRAIHMSNPRKLWLAYSSDEKMQNFIICLLQAHGSLKLSPDNYFDFLSETFSISKDFLKELVPKLKTTEMANHLRNLQFLTFFLATFYNINEQDLRTHKALVQSLFHLRTPHLRTDALHFLLENQIFTLPAAGPTSKGTRLQHLTEALLIPLFPSLPANRAFVKTLMAKLYKGDYMDSDFNREQVLIQFLLAIQKNLDLSPEDQFALLEKVMTPFLKAEALEKEIQKTTSPENQLALYKKSVSEETFAQSTQNIKEVKDQLARLKKYSFVEAQKKALHIMQDICRILPYCAEREDLDELKKVAFDEIPLLFESLFRRSIGDINVTDFEERYARTIDAYRHKDLLFLYASQHKGNPLIATLFEDVLNDTFLINRYSHEKQPHFRLLFNVQGLSGPDKEAKQQLENQWKTGKRIPLSQLNNESDFENVAFPEAFKHYTLEDTDAFNDLLVVGIGESCQKIVGGGPGLNVGLLGYMLNGYNRAVIVKDEVGNIIGRSLLRIYWDAKNNTPVLFRDSFYGNADVKNLVDAMCLQKAKEMNLPLTAIAEERGIPYQGTLEASGGRSKYDYVDALKNLQTSSYYTLPSAVLIWEPPGKK